MLLLAELILPDREPVSLQVQWQKLWASYAPLAPLPLTAYVTCGKLLAVELFGVLPFIYTTQQPEQQVIEVSGVNKEGPKHLWRSC